MEIPEDSEKIHEDSETENTSKNSFPLLDIAWKKDKLVEPIPNLVILHQYRRAYLCPNFSTACLKIETFLRIHNIKYVIYDKYKWKGLDRSVPSIFINSDTELIPKDAIGLLTDKFSLDINPGLSNNEIAVSNAFQVMIEEQLIPCLELDRYCYKDWNDYTMLIPPLVPNYMKFMNYYRWKGIGRKVLKRYQAHGIGFVPPERLQPLALGNIEAISLLLGEKKFIFGDNVTYLDIVVFAVMSQFYFVTPSSNPIRKDIVKYSNLQEHHFQVKTLAFPDWNEICVNDF